MLLSSRVLSVSVTIRQFVLSLLGSCHTGKCMIDFYARLPMRFFFFHDFFPFLSLFLISIKCFWCEPMINIQQSFSLIFISHEHERTEYSNWLFYGFAFSNVLFSIHSSFLIFCFACILFHDSLGFSSGAFVIAVERKEKTGKKVQLIQSGDGICIYSIGHWKRARTAAASPPKWHR